VVTEQLAEERAKFSDALGKELVERVNEAQHELSKCEKHYSAVGAALCKELHVSQSPGPHVRHKGTGGRNIDADSLIICQPPRACTRVSYIVKLSLRGGR
jgi:hypothetical protein